MKKLIALSEANHAFLVDYLKYCERTCPTKDTHALIKDLLVEIEAEQSPSELAQAAVESGVTLVEFMANFGTAKAGNPYAEAAEDIFKNRFGHGDDIEFDDILVVERTLNGAFVTSSVWVASGDAGAMDITDNIESMHQMILREIPASELESTELLLADKADFLVSLIRDGAGDTLNYKLHAIGGESPLSKIMLAGEIREVTISGLIRDVAARAGELGYDQFQLEQVGLWLDEYAVDLDTKFQRVMYQCSPN